MDGEHVDQSGPEYQLNSYFDVVIVGTGLTESIVSAACARAGKTVLHLDANDYYGDLWASVCFRQLMILIDKERRKYAERGTTEMNNDVPLVRDVHLGLPYDWDNHYEAISNVEMLSYLIKNDDWDDSGDDTRGIDNIIRLLAQQRCEETGEQYSELSSLTDDEEEAVCQPSGDSKERVWSYKDVLAKDRRFNIDLNPKIIYSSGEMVKLLVSSNISRYALFKSVMRFLYAKNHVDDIDIVEVPYSRQSIFLSSEISLIEKRLLMRFIHYCLEFECKDMHADEVEAFSRKPFVEFLQSKQLNDKLIDIILNCVSFSDDKILTSDAMKMVKKFIESTGRYGNTPFLYTLYGSGELPQAFCRLSAVFGGMYWMGRVFDKVEFLEEGHGIMITFGGANIKCDHLVSGVTTTPKKFVTSQVRKKISRAILITNGSIKDCDAELDKHCTFLLFPKSEHNKSVVHLTELSTAMNVVPEQLYLVYMWCDSVEEKAKKDLLPITKKLFDFNIGKSKTNKPRVLWSMYYNQEFVDCTQGEQSHERLHIVSTPSNTMDYEFAIKEAKAIFHRIMPDEEFLPRAPDPDEILFEQGEQNEPLQLPAHANGNGANAN